MEGVGPGPTAKAFEHRSRLRNSPAARRCARSWHSRHEQTRIAPGLARVAGLAKAERLDDRPLGIGYNATALQAASRVYSLESDNHAICQSLKSTNLGGVGIVEFKPLRMHPVDGGFKGTDGFRPVERFVGIAVF